MSDIDVLVVGSIAYDTISTPAGSIEDGIGGSATYGSLASSFHSKLINGGDVALVGVVGNDFKESDLEIFSKSGIKTNGLEIAEGETFRWSGSYHGSMAEAKTHDTKLNVFEFFNPKVPGEHSKPQITFCANLHPSIQKSVLEQSQPERITMLDSMNLWIDIARDDLVDVLSKVDLVILNDGEIKMLAGSDNLLQACEDVKNSTGASILVVKKGEHGVLAWHDSGLISLPAFPTKNLTDPTGCGDTFAGTIAARLAQGSGDISIQELREALIHATVTASFTLESFSINRLFELDQEEYNSRVAEYKNIVFGQD